jgi:hypothetical protein
MKRSTLWCLILCASCFTEMSSAQIVPMTNDECANAIPLNAGVNPATGFFTNVGATNSAGMGDPCQFGNIGFADVFFYYTPPCSASVTVSTCTPPGKPPGTNGNTHIDIYPASACPTGTPSAIACNDDSGCGLPGLGGFLSSLTFAGVGGQIYLIRVANYDYGTPIATYHPGTFYVTVTAATAAKAQVGPGCSSLGAGGAPILDIDAPPVLGSTRTLQITGAVANSPGLLLFSSPGASSPIAGGCTLYVVQAQMVIFQFVATNGFGSWSFTGSVPSDPSVECGKLILQAAILPVTGNPSYQVTSGLECTLGY